MCVCMCMHMYICVYTCVCVCVCVYVCGSELVYMKYNVSYKALFIYFVRITLRMASLGTLLLYSEGQHAWLCS